MARPLMPAGGNDGHFKSEFVLRGAPLPRKCLPQQGHHHFIIYFDVVTPRIVQSPVSRTLFKMRSSRRMMKVKQCRLGLLSLSAA